MSECFDAAPSLACYDDGTGNLQTLFAHMRYERADDGTVGLVSVAYTDSDGAAVDTSGGTVTPGACPVAQPDVEWKTLCDVLADGTSVPFCRQIITNFDASGAAIVPPVTADYETDQATPYTIAGTVGDCPACDPVDSATALATF
jgi:hypothetical protein